jgi:poly-gamma-glutamate synthesis protein (capsule biosynthesis protein)
MMVRVCGGVLALMVLLSLSPVQAAMPEGLRPSPFAFPATDPASATLTIAAVGDVLLHTPLHQQALSAPDGHRSLWAPVEPWIAGADLAYANLEGPAATGVRAGGVAVPDPGAVFDGRVYGSYPAFNYHASLVTDLVASGFDVVSTANNHALDRGALGIDRTLAALTAAHLPFTGSRMSTDPASPEQADWATVVTHNGWRVAWLACAFGTNGIPDRHHQVLNCFSDQAVVLAQVRALAARADIDAVIVTPHVGIEYEDRPRPEVVRLDRALIDAGALAVLGAHPHVTQPWEIHTAPDGRVGLIVYSLGNFVSGQFQRVPTRASVLVGLTLAKSPQGRVTIREAGYLPLEMAHRDGRYAVRPITATTGTPAMWQRLTGMFDHGTASGAPATPTAP